MNSDDDIMHEPSDSRPDLLPQSCVQTFDENNPSANCGFRTECENELGGNISNYGISNLNNDAATKLTLLTKVHSYSGRTCKESGNKIYSEFSNGCDFKYENGFTENDLQTQVGEDANCKKLIINGHYDVSEGSRRELELPADVFKARKDLYHNSASSLLAGDNLEHPYNTNEIINQSSPVDCIDKNECCTENILLPQPLTIPYTPQNKLKQGQSRPCESPVDTDLVYVRYESEFQMPDIMRLIQKDLSEPYSIYTYRYFIHNWPELCFLAKIGDKCVGAIVCKLDHHNKVKRGYIAMLAVDENCRKRKIGSSLVLKAIQAMISGEAGEIVLETEITNKPALKLYENLGFVRDKRLFRYYLNGVDALRLKLWIH